MVLAGCLQPYSFRAGVVKRYFSGGQKVQIPFPFESMLLFGSLATMLLIGVVLRANIPFFQHFLIPSCLIGGVLGLILLNTGVFRLSVSNLETFAYHFFNISFISVGLTNSGNNANRGFRDKGFFKGPLWMAQYFKKSVTRTAATANMTMA